MIIKIKIKTTLITITIKETKINKMTITGINTVMEDWEEVFMEDNNLSCQVKSMIISKEHLNNHLNNQIKFRKMMEDWPKL